MEVTNGQLAQMIADNTKLCDVQFKQLRETNDEIKKGLESHVKEDIATHDIVMRHANYWTLVIYVGGIAVLAALSFLGLKH